ncbi:cyclic nucleotide-binding domain-containing protein [Rhizobiaceae bacterium n13]|uniref:Cyclic nucleotide-binding domain-containing protein n=1 Tax=Ferirhizobium litorale TaxID=2927786 RepID=A0AAE3QID8_9HYPH|nr:cyclic nucleotide-binding domain-containing protein [Fererhizobium litorale]MDI7862394.1 cyclic nucleotide-binding domain-containing protein [Fererhizobium litorale]MDI7923719.1 cyclic nucleotide-binding domain-containing protein [Fererhizobium litorale]
MALSDDIRLLANVPLFSGLGEDQLRLIAFGAERRHLASGQTLFREKSPAECAYVVASGDVALNATGRSGKSEVAGHAGPGTLLSELAMVTLVERKFTAVATQDSEVIRISRALFHRLLEEYPDIAAAVESRIRDNLAAMATQAAAMQHRFD